MFQLCNMLPWFFIPSGHHIKYFITIQCSRASFFSLSQRYQVACPHPLLSSVKWLVCFFSTLNQAHSIVCHHPVFHAGDKVLTFPRAFWVIPRVNIGQVVYHLSFQFFGMLQVLLVHPGSNTPVV